MKNPLRCLEDQLTDIADLISLTADIVSAHVSNNSISPSDVPGLINAVHGALTELGAPAPAIEEELKPAVAIRSSVKPDYIVCLEDGKKLKMMKRYLRTNYNMTPQDYRAKWGLPRDYPMVAPNYAAQRQELAVKIGLGRKASETKTTPKARSQAKAATAASATQSAAKGTPAKSAAKAAPAKSVAKTAHKAGAVQPASKTGEKKSAAKPAPKKSLAKATVAKSTPKPAAAEPAAATSQVKRRGRPKAAAAA